jgi:hypothetical protein
VNISLLLVNN